MHLICDSWVIEIIYKYIHADLVQHCHLYQMLVVFLFLFFFTKCITSFVIGTVGYAFYAPDIWLLIKKVVLFLLLLSPLRKTTSWGCSWLLGNIWVFLKYWGKKVKFHSPLWEEWIVTNLMFLKLYYDNLKLLASLWNSLSQTGHTGICYNVWGGFCLWVWDPGLQTCD